MLAREFKILIFIILHRRKTTFFVNYSDSDIWKLVSSVVSEMTKKSTKYEPETEKAKERQVHEFWCNGKVSFTSQSVVLG